MMVNPDGAGIVSKYFETFRCLVRVFGTATVTDGLPLDRNCGECNALLICRFPVYCDAGSRQAARRG
ncbi:MAG TPA: hypothetical protein VMD92_10545, partial [Acidobacteriaceae bacterium]|nr:hypothetical protein [Acidobacteriaceae bacterium]